MLTDRELEKLSRMLLSGSGKPPKKVREAKRVPLTVDRLLVELGLKPKPSKLAVEKLVRAIKG